MAVKTYTKNSRVKLSPNFLVREFKCKCSRCTSVKVDTDLVAILQNIRDHFGASVIINSGYRCPEHNTEVGGAPSSFHIKGMAADIVVVGVEPVEVARYAESIGVKRIGLYDKQYGDFVHIDTHTTKYFWHNIDSNSVKTFIEKTPETFTVEMTVLERGMKGDEVEGVQALLIGYGHKLDKDGDFGPATEKAVKAYQKSVGLKQTGVVDEVTRKSMMGL